MASCSRSGWAAARPPPRCADAEVSARRAAGPWLAMSAAWIGAAVLMLGLACIVVPGWAALRRRQRMRRRLSLVAGVLEADETAASAAIAPAARPDRSEHAPHPVVAFLGARYPLSGGVRTGGIATASGLVAVLALVPALAFVGLPVALAWAGSLAAAFGIGWAIGDVREKAARTAFSDGFLVAAENFQRMVRFGIGAGQAFTSVAESAEGAMGDSLRTISLEVEFGVPLAGAMEREARRVRMSELAMLAAILGTQSGTGGALSEAVDNLTGMLRERRDNRARTQAATAESRITLIILAMVPLVAIGLQAALQPDMVRVLLEEARHLLGIGFGLIVGGLLVSWMIVRRAQR